MAVNFYENARARARALRENAAKVELRLTEERKTRDALRNAKPVPVMELRAAERTVELDQDTVVWLTHKANDWDEIARLGR